MKRQYGDLGLTTTICHGIPAMNDKNPLQLPLRVVWLVESTLFRAHALHLQSE